MYGIGTSAAMPFLSAAAVDWKTVEGDTETQSLGSAGGDDKILKGRSLFWRFSTVS